VDRCGGMAGVDGRASSPREIGGGGEGYGTTLPARKRACRARGAASPRGVQPVGAYESAARVGQVLKELDEELDRREQSGVCLEEGIVIRAVTSQGCMGAGGKPGYAAEHRASAFRRLSTSCPPVSSQIGVFALPTHQFRRREGQKGPHSPRRRPARARSGRDDAIRFAIQRGSSFRSLTTQSRR